MTARGEAAAATEAAASGPPRALLEQLSGALWSTDSELRITFAAGQLAHELVPAARSLVGLTVADAFDERDPTRAPFAQHLAALAGSPQSFELERAGRQLEIRIDPFRGPDGSVVGCLAHARDVTAREQAIARLRSSEHRLELAQRLAHVGTIEWDMGTDQMSWSDEVYAILGLDRSARGEPETYASFMACIHPADRAAVEQALFGASRTGEPFSFTHRVVRPDGSTRTVQTRGEIQREGERGSSRLLGTCVDVTQATEAGHQLEHTASVLHATLEATADGILVVDSAGAVLEYNERFGSMWKLPRSALALRRRSVLFDEIREQLESQESFDRDVRDLTEHPESESFQVLRLKDDRVFEAYSRPRRIGDRIEGRVWSFRDVTERDRLYARAVFLAEATRLLTSLDLDSALHAVAHLALPFIGEACAVDLFGDGAPRRLFSVSTDPALVVATDLPASIGEGHPSIHTVGSRCYMTVPLVVKTRVLGAMTFVAREGHVYSQADMELADMLGQRASLAYANAQLYQGARDALRARDEFLAIVAHEIRNPITSIHIAATMLHTKRLGSDEQQRSLAIIEREDRRLSRFVDELLDIGRVRAGRLQFTFEEVDLVGVVRDAVEDLAADLSRAGSKLSMTGDARVVGNWDRDRLHEIASHLLSNAVKFGRGRPIEIIVNASKDKATLSVIDHGIGIDPEQRERIFHPFERGVSTRHYGGLGLGLFIVRTLVEGMGGAVNVASTPGGGATFTVELPMKEPS